MSRFLKLFALVLALGTAVTLVGCGGEKAKDKMGDGKMDPKMDGKMDPKM